MLPFSSVVLIGNGPWGRCLIPIIKKTQSITWVFRSQQRLEETKILIKDSTIIYTSDFPSITEDALVIYAIPSDQLVRHVQENFPKGVHPFILITSKGLCPETGQIYSAILEKEGYDLNKIAFFAGASYAQEVNEHASTLITLASVNSLYAESLKELLSNQENIRYEFTSNIVSVQLWSVVKNLAACAAAFIYHENSSVPSELKPLILKLILKEFSNYLEQKHGWSLFDNYIFSAGIGDCYLSATSSQSRNYCYGQLLAGQQNLESYLKTTTIEVKNTLNLLSHENLNSYPLLKCFVNLHQQNINPEDVDQLFIRELITKEFKLNLSASLMSIFFKIQQFEKKNDQAAHLVTALNHMQNLTDHLSIIVGFIDQHYQHHLPCVIFSEKKILFSNLESRSLNTTMKKNTLSPD